MPPDDLYALNCNYMNTQSLIDAKYSSSLMSSALTSRRKSHNGECKKIRALVFWCSDSKSSNNRLSSYKTSPSSSCSSLSSSPSKYSLHRRNSHSDHHHYDLNKILKKQCEIVLLKGSGRSDQAEYGGKIRLERIKESKTNCCLTTYIYRYTDYQDDQTTNSIQIKFHLIQWPDAYDFRSEFFEHQFARKYFSMTNLAIGFYSPGNMDSFCYVQSWLKAFDQYWKKTYACRIQLYLVQFGPGDGANAVDDDDMVYMIDDFLKHFNVRYIGGRSKVNGNHSSIFNRKRRTSFQSNSNIIGHDDHDDVGHLEPLFRRIIKMNHPTQSTDQLQLSASRNFLHQSSSFSSSSSSSSTMMMENAVNQLHPTNTTGSKSSKRYQQSHSSGATPGTLYWWMLILGNTSMTTTANSGAFMNVMSRYIKIKLKSWWHQMF